LFLKVLVLLLAPPTVDDLGLDSLNRGFDVVNFLHVVLCLFRERSIALLKLCELFFAHA
jgi:hypothetical protein